jgi:hypothetical protein
MTNLHDLIDAMRAGKVWDASFRQNTKQKFPKQHFWALDAAKHAVCFHMGDCNDVPKLSLITDLLRMPYPVTWLEGATIDGFLGLLVCECEDGLISVAVFNKKPGVPWYWIGVFDILPNGKDDFHCQARARFSEDDAWNDGALEYAAKAANTMVRFVMALNCVNTKRVEHPAPKFMNQKRSAKGKQPLFSFWTLHLPAPAANDGPLLGGTHASPRLHLRRGHIRQYAPGKYTWVEACVVGSKQAGIVSKDYAMSA